MTRIFSPPVSVSNRAYQRVAHSLNVVFALQARDLIRQLSNGNFLSRGSFDLSHWEGRMVEALRPVFFPIWRVGRVQGFDQLRRHPASKSLRFLTDKSLSKVKVVVKARPSIGTDFDLVSPHALKEVDKLVLAFSESTNATVVGNLNDALKEVRQQLREGLSSGDAYRTIQAKIANTIRDPARSWLIATTETSRIQNAGNVSSYKQSNLATGLRWVTTSDPCEKICQPLEGKEVDFDEPFIILPKGPPQYRIVYHPPAHPRCYCTINPVLGAAKPKPTHFLPPSYVPHSAEPSRLGFHVSPANLAGVPSRKDPRTDPALPAEAERVAKLIEDDADAEVKAAALTARENPALAQLKETDRKIAAAKDEMTTLSRKMDKTKDPALKKEVFQRYQQIEQLKKERKEYEAKVKDHNAARLAEAFAHPDPVPVTWQLAGFAAFPPQLKARVDAATQLLSKILGRSKAGESSLRLQFALIPPDQEQREHQKDGRVFLTPQSSLSTILHEVGHALEHLYPDLGRAARGFWFKRCGKEEPVNLAEEFGGYAGDEEGYRDDWAKIWGKGTKESVYMGKAYPGGETEITSMLLQALVDRPAELVKDREAFAFITGVLRGTLR